MKISVLTTLLISIFLNQNILAQCSGGSLAGTLNPTAAYQTQAISTGQFYNVNVTCGSSYNFSFCSNGGFAGFDTQITILDNAGAYLGYGYNDDFCGLQSDVSFTSTFTGIVRVLLSSFPCINDGSFSGTLAYNSSIVTISPTFTLSATSCSQASAAITGTTGGVFSFNPVPVDGAIINSSTGAISNGAGGATYTVQYTVCGSSSTQNVTLPFGNPTFSMTTVCGGGTSTISGTLGGTFSFNPSPGDGAQINSSTGMLTNGTPGTTYFVEYSVCGSSSIESVLVLTDDCFTLNGSAQYISVLGEDCIQLTQEVNNQTGCAWNGSQVDFNSNFSLSLNYYFGNNVNGADGNTFTFQPSSSGACGQNGGQLGAGGLTNALSVEFDTYDNDNPAHVYDMSCDHVAIEIDGDMLGPGAPFTGPVCAKSGGGNIDDGGTYNVEIEWNAALQQLNVFFDGDLRLSSTSDFVNTAFGGQSLVYWGATSATGGLNNQQYFCPSTVIVLPAELVSFSSICEGENEEFVWTTASEDRVDYFEIEYTTDGFIFYPIGQVKAAGNSSTANHYRLASNLEGITQRYYRIKTVDEDGNFETSEMIAGKNCKSPSLIQNYAFENGQFHFETSVENALVQLLTTTGQTLFSYEMKDEYVAEIANIDLAQGIYILTVKDLANGKRETLRLFHVKN